MMRSKPLSGFGAAVACLLAASCATGNDVTLVDSNNSPIAAVDFTIDETKPPQPYDAFIMRAIADIASFWSDSYPSAYGGSYVELKGGVHPDYPGNTNVLPNGCDYTGDYSFVEDNAFYCDEGDFIVYDDSKLFPDFADQFGEAVVGVILAHEWAHAIQGPHRHDILNRYTSTTIELQADCFAGAWAAHVKADGLGPFTMGDNDITGALLGLVQIGDAPGDSAYDAAAHGSAFDRVSAFQDGFTGGTQPCVDYEVNEPLPLQFGFSDEELMQPNPGDFPFGAEMFSQLGDDLTLYWTAQLQGTATATGTWTAPTLRVDDVGDGEPDCSQRTAVVDGVWFCGTDDIVVLDRMTAQKFYEQIPGDFAVGYLMGLGFGEAVQQALDSSLDGKERALLNDCLVGMWARDILPFNQDPVVAPSENTPRVALSPGDLDEAIRTALNLGDSYYSLGSPFDKVDSFRKGVLTGADACFA